MALYRKAHLQEMSPWTVETDMTDVSVSVADKGNGSPLPGDMIAVGKLPSDKWLVAAVFFKKNYEEV